MSADAAFAKITAVRTSTPREDMPGTASDADENHSIYGNDHIHGTTRCGFDDLTVNPADIPKDDEKAPITNGHNDEAAVDGGPPLKKRRVSEVAPSSLARKKQESPPWKRIVAEGPSSFTEGGRRKSGRTNLIPLELQPPSDKRQTRGAQKTYSGKNKLSSTGSVRSSLHPTSQDASAAGGNSSRKPLSAGKPEHNQANKTSPKAMASPKRHRRLSNSDEMSPTPTRPSKRSSKHSVTSTSYHVNGNTRKSTRKPDTVLETTPKTNGFHSTDASPDSKSKTPRIRFRINPPSLPLIHPETAIRKAKLFPTFDEYMEKAGDIPIDKGGLLAPDDDAKYTPDMVEREARLILRLEEAAEPGGILSPEVFSAYRPEESDMDKDKRIRQYSHQDHLVRAVTEFRLLMVAEQRNHRKIAKRLAEICRDEWVRKQPKTEEQIQAEAIKLVQGRHKAVLRSLQATWENVKAEVNRRRIVQWEAEEQARVRKALNEAVDISTQKLEARRTYRDSEAPSEAETHGTDIDEDDEGTGSADESDSNMSSSESEDEERHSNAEVVDDEHLTVEELRQKYASLPETTQVIDIGDVESSDDDEQLLGVSTGVSVAEDSDESVDMDDDMGSSDDERGSDDDEEGSTGADGEDDDDDGAAEPSLLGFLAPSDRASLAIVTASPSPPSDRMEEDILDEEDEVSLIPASAPHGPPTPTVNGDQSLAKELPDSQDVKINGTQPSPDVEADTDIEMISGEFSSQPTPVTTDTKHSEDSASSVELHHSSRNVTHSATPQPVTKLKTPIPFLLRGTLRDYQHYGLDWLAGLYAQNTNGILADEMGLGKTIQTIALLAHLACEHQVWGTHLVIVPTSVMLNWEMEFKKWCPGFKVLTYYGNIEERRRMRVGWLNDDAYNVVITSYQLVLADAASFKKRKWHYMILDEAHNIKNFRSKRWQTLLMFNTRARLLLTGTPLQNNLTELWSLLFFLMPSDGTEQGMEGFADLKEFSDWFRKPQDQILENGRETMDDEARAIISKLHKVLRPYLLRRMKADVEKQMPGKYEHVEYCRLSRRQRELYDGFLARSDTRGTLASGNYLSIINCLMQLRKVCNHPDLFQERPILSSFPMKKSAIADFEIQDLLVRRRLLHQDPMSTVSLEFLNLVPTRHEHLSSTISERAGMLTAQRVLMDMREAQRIRAQYALTTMDSSTVKSNLVYLESAARWTRFEELQHCVYLNALRRQQKPIYGRHLVQLLDFGLKQRPVQLRPRPSNPERLLEWMQEPSDILRQIIPSLAQRSEMLEPIIQKFACLTPPIIASDALPLLVSRRGMEYFQTAPNRDKVDPFHEARMRLSIQFPDKRLLQYDCGKLQTLDRLLRKLQSGGHRVLIFTQMTKVLDILEQFLNIHGHKYLRLDGNTKVEQRQILTDRFNNDKRILVFILSSRSGGIGINLTGADTVIFYDLDWNPAMDKQCQDRCHRIGQTRDVHIYRLVSEHTIEANILRKANQKRMLDDVVIQEGEFTTDYFNKTPARGAVVDDEGVLDDDAAAASAAMDRVLGGPASGGERVFEQAEDQEDIAALKVAQQEIQVDDADFDERTVNPTTTPKTGTGTPMDGLPTPATAGTPAADLDTAMGGITEINEDDLNAWGQPVESIDDYMLRIMTTQLKDTPLELPKDKVKSKKGKDAHRNRLHRPR